MDVGKIVGKFLGNKSDRDMKEVTPYVAKVAAEFDKLEGITNDELRGRSAALKQRIEEYVSAEKNLVAETKKKAEDPEVDVNEKETLYHDIDKLEIQIDDKYEEILEVVLPESFAIVKETAKRFKENSELEVTAQDFDRTVAAGRDSVEINGDKVL